MDKRTILVVEDDSVLRSVLIEKLRKTGYEAQGAEDGEVALSILKQTPPDLVLLDILMPKKDGMQVLEEMHADGNLSRVPVIVISNSGQPVEIERALELGAKDFLVKAVFDPSEVLEKVEKVLGGEPVNLGEKEAGGIRNPVSAEQKPVPNAPAQATNVSGAQYKVLVVEDDKFLRELFVRKLYSEGFDVRNAIEAKQAFDLLAEDKPHIILLDLILPGMDGFEILSRLKGDKNYADIPVIVLSNLGQQEDIDKSMSLGAEDFLVKANFTLDEIIERIRKVLEKYRS